MKNHHNSLHQKHNSVVIENYILEYRLGSGSFGDVYLAYDKKTKEEKAAKVEEKKKHHSRLYDEYKIYKKLNHKKIQGIPKVYDFIETPKYNILIMELLKYNLEKIFIDYNKKFKLETILLLAMDIITLVKNMHEAGYIHRDIKPNNFMTDVKDKSKILIMDFGLSKKYITSDKKHIACRMDRSLVGTARYSSINVHMGIEPSRRDDLESVGYMLLFFALGKLPWQGLKKKLNEDEHLEQIGDIKLCTNFDKLCSNLPECFKIYIDYCRKLEFESTPDYEYLISLFRNTVIEKKLVVKYEWCK